jgi:hypothetical protein
VAEGTATFTWPDAVRKARKAAESLAWRLAHVHGLHEFRIDHLGAGGLVPLPGVDESTVREVVVRAAVAAPSAEQAALLHGELANFYDCAPAGACGSSGPTAGSQSGARERIDILPIDILPCLLPVSELTTSVQLV